MCRRSSMQEEGNEGNRKRMQRWRGSATLRQHRTFKQQIHVLVSGSLNGCSGAITAGRWLLHLHGVCVCKVRAVATHWMSTRTCSNLDSDTGFGLPATNLVGVRLSTCLFVRGALARVFLGHLCTIWPESTGFERELTLGMRTQETRKSISDTGRACSQKDCHCRTPGAAVQSAQDGLSPPR